MGAFQPMHLVIVGIIALLVFGPKKLPELARGVGEAMKEFKKTMNSHDEPEPAPPVVASAALPSEHAGGAAPAESNPGASTSPHI